MYALAINGSPRQEGMINVRHLGAVIAWLGESLQDRLHLYPTP